MTIISDNKLPDWMHEEIEKIVRETVRDQLLAEAKNNPIPVSITLSGQEGFDPRIAETVKSIAAKVVRDYDRARRR